MINYSYKIKNRSSKQIFLFKYYLLIMPILKF